MADEPSSRLPAPSAPDPTLGSASHDTDPLARLRSGVAAGGSSTFDELVARLAGVREAGPGRLVRTGVGVVLAAGVLAAVVVALGLGRGDDTDVAERLPRARPGTSVQAVPPGGDGDGAVGAGGPARSGLSGNGEPLAASGDPGPVGSVPASVWVHAAGGVARPGLYAVRTGARVADVVAVAGGPAPDADLDRVNLAAPVADGERVYVPRRGEEEPPVVVGNPAGGAPAGGPGGVSGGSGGPGSAPSAAAPLDLNRAGVDELDRLPGVGPTTAAAIVAWRDAHGAFRSVDDLTQVRGIGPAKLEQLRPLVRV